MKESRRRVHILSALTALCVVAIAFWIAHSATEQTHKVVFSNGSWLLVRKVSYGTNNVYWHHPARRTIAALGIERAWEWGIDRFPRLFSKLGATEVNSSVQSDDCLVVFGEFYPGLAKTRSFEFTGIDGDGKESGPLETDALLDSSGSTKINACILAYGTNVSKQWPISVRIYERGTNGPRKLLAQVPAKRAEK